MSHSLIVIGQAHGSHTPPPTYSSPTPVSAPSPSVPSSPPHREPNPRLLLSCTYVEPESGARLPRRADDKIYLWAWPGQKIPQHTRRSQDCGRNFVPLTGEIANLGRLLVLLHSRMQSRTIHGSNLTSGRGDDANSGRGINSPSSVILAVWWLNTSSPLPLTNSLTAAQVHVRVGHCSQISLVANLAFVQITARGHSRAGTCHDSSRLIRH